MFNEQFVSDIINNQLVSNLYFSFCLHTQYCEIYSFPSTHKIAVQGGEGGEAGGEGRPRGGRDVNWNLQATQTFDVWDLAINQ